MDVRTISIKKIDRVCNYPNLPVYTSNSDCKCLSAWNRFAVLSVKRNAGCLLVLPTNSSHPVTEKTPVICCSPYCVSAFDISPFSEDMVINACIDNSIQLWNLSNRGLEDNLNNPVMTYKHHSHRITCLDFNPVTKGIFSSCSTNGDYAIWNVDSNKPVITDSLKSRQASTLKWHAYGDVFCVGCKTRLYQIMDPRSQESICEWIGHSSNRTSQMTWLDTSTQLVTTGFSSQNICEMILHDIRNISTPVATLTLPMCHNNVTPIYSSNLLYIYEKGTSVFTVVQPSSLPQIAELGKSANSFSCQLSLPSSTKEMVLLNPSSGRSPSEISRFLHLRDDNGLECISLHNKATTFRLTFQRNDYCMMKKDWLAGNCMDHSISFIKSQLIQPHLPPDQLKQCCDIGNRPRLNSVTGTAFTFSSHTECSSPVLKPVSNRMECNSPVQKSPSINRLECNSPVQKSPSINRLECNSPLLKSSSSNLSPPPFLLRSGTSTFPPQQLFSSSPQLVGPSSPSSHSLNHQNSPQGSSHCSPNPSSYRSAQSTPQGSPPPISLPPLSTTMNCSTHSLLGITSQSPQSSDIQTGQVRLPPSLGSPRQARSAVPATTPCTSSVSKNSSLSLLDLQEDINRIHSVDIPRLEKKLDTIDELKEIILKQQQQIDSLMKMISELKHE